MMAWLAQWLDGIVLTILALMGLIAVWIGFERWLYFRSAPAQTFESLQQARIETTRHLTLLASIGTNAPYVGLLGTVLALMTTFWQIGQADRITTHAIMNGLSMALKATAAGIFVAIVSMMLYNALLRRAEVIQLEVEASEKVRSD